MSGVFYRTHYIEFYVNTPKRLFKSEKNSEQLNSFINTAPELQRHRVSLGQR